LSFEFEYDNEFMPKRSQCLVKVSTGEGRLDPEEDISQAGEFGFMDVIEELIEGEKPLITHNGFLDLLHLYSNFVGKLPEKSSDFKTKFNKTFPHVYDTKYLVNSASKLYSHTNRFTALGDCYSEIEAIPSPEIVIPEEFSAYAPK
jgi:hypothetical protein